VGSYGWYTEAIQRMKAPLMSDVLAGPRWKLDRILDFIYVSKGVQISWWTSGRPLSLFSSIAVNQGFRPLISVSMTINTSPKFT
jgi:hypothetical protein